MKKLLLSLAALAAFGFANAEEVTFTFNGSEAEVYGLTRTSDNNSSYYGEDPGTPMTEGAVTINLLKKPFGTYSGSGVRLWTDGLRVMKNAGFTISVNGGEITNVAITTVKANGCNSLVIDGTPAEMTLDANNKLGTWTGSAATLAFANDATKGLKGTLAIASIKVTFTGGVVDTRKDAGLSFPEASYTVKLGEAFTAPVLTKATNAAVTYSSSADEIVAVNPTTGDVEILAVGNAVITASAEANDEFKAGKASYEVIVKDPNLILDADFAKDECGFTIEDGTLPEGLTYVWKYDSSFGYMKASAYKDKVNYAVEGAYLVSPELDLTNCAEAKLAFRHAANYFASVDAAKTECTLHVRENGGAWGEAITIPGWPEKLGWTWTDSGEINLAAYLGKKIQLGFKYTSTADKAGTWEIDNVKVSAKKSDAVEAVVAADEEAPVEYYNLQGVRVANPEGGIFIRRQGASVSKVVIR